MRRFSIRDVCRILGVKPHVLRYWEQMFPLLAPEKDHAGRRLYSTADLQVLFRIRYLLYERRYTVNGARKKLWEELGDPSADLRAQVHAVRATLLELSDLVGAWRTRFEAVERRNDRIRSASMPSPPDWNLTRDRIVGLDSPSSAGS